MPDYTPNEIVDMLLMLGRCGGNYLRAARDYQRQYPGRRHPSYRSIQNLEHRARRGRLVRQRRRQDINEDFHGPHAARNMAVLAMVSIDPHLSVRVIEERLGVPRNTVHRILRSARLHPYRIMYHQALPNPLDPLNRMAFCRWSLERIQQFQFFFRYVCFSDESIFNNRGQVNRWNFRYWSENNPHWLRQINHQYRWSLHVWCGIVNGQLIGPYFFNRTVSAASYLNFLQHDFPGLLDVLDLDTRRRMWFQQDGAPAHWAHVVRDHLNATFGDRWIGRGGPIPWPPRSPDLTSPDFFLWGYLKDIVYRDPPTTRENMMERITTACRAIPRHVLLSTVDSFERRIQACLDNNGGIFEHL